MPLQLTVPTAPELADFYRGQGLWARVPLRSGLEQAAVRDRPFLSSPLATLTGLSQLLMSLQGASIFLEDHFDPVRSLASIEEYRATVIGGAPVILEIQDRPHPAPRLAPGARTS
jgi:hypothetical protein